TRARDGRGPPRRVGRRVGAGSERGHAPNGKGLTPAFCVAPSRGTSLFSERKRGFRSDQGGVISVGQGTPPTPQFFGEWPSTTTQVCSRNPSVVASQSASVSPAISLRLVSSSIRKSNSLTSISGIALARGLARDSPVLGRDALNDDVDVLLRRAARLV